MGNLELSPLPIIMVYMCRAAVVANTKAPKTDKRWKKKIIRMQYKRRLKKELKKKKCVS